MVVIDQDKITMDPFAHLPEYPFIFCTKCRFACITNEVPTHLQRHHISINARQRAEIAQAVRSIPGLLQNQNELRAFPLLPPTTKPIPLLPPPQNDGLQCVECPYIARQVRSIQEHCRTIHGWQNPVRKGGYMKQRARQPREVPWRTGISCQRLFPSRAASGWFEVGRGLQPRGQVTGPVDDLQAIWDQQTAKCADAERAIEVANEKKEPNPWVERTGWARHLEGLAPIRLRDTIRPVEENEPALAFILASFTRVIHSARQTAHPKRVGLAILFEAERREVHSKPDKPLDNRLEETTWAQYQSTFRKLLRYLIRVEEWDNDLQPPYRLTTKQGNLLDAFCEAAEAMATEGVADIGEAMLDRLCVDTIIALFDHRVKETQYENAIVSGLAVLGIEEDGG